MSGRRGKQSLQTANNGKPYGELCVAVASFLLSVLPPHQRGYPVNAPCHDAHEHLSLPLRRCRRSFAERLCVAGEAHPAQGHDEEREDRGDGERSEKPDGQVEWDLGIAPIHSLEHRDVADHKHQV